MAYQLDDRSQAVHQEYDVVRGYGDLYRRARTAMPQDHLPPSPLTEMGFAVLPCLSASDVAWLHEAAFDRDGNTRIPDLSATDLSDLLDLLLRPHLDEAVRAAFGTPYAVLFANPTHTVPEIVDDPYQSVSYRWHRDGGPTRHLKFIIYLDGPEAHDGATEVIDGPVSDRLAAIGYGLGPIPQRLDDLTELARDHGLQPLPIRRLVPAAGSGLLFDPYRIVHRGVAPTWGRRRVFTLGFVPFPQYWANAKDYLLPLIRTNHACSFPQWQSQR